LIGFFRIYILLIQSAIEILILYPGEKSDVFMLILKNPVNPVYCSELDRICIL